MKTVALIRLMAADTRTGPTLGRALVVALAAGLAAAVSPLLHRTRIPQGLLDALATPRVLVKLAVVVLLSAASLMLVARAGRPEADLARPPAPSSSPPQSSLRPSAAKFLVVPESDWRTSLIGHNPPPASPW